MKKNKIIYLAGIASNNSWSLVGQGSTIEQARADYKKALAVLGFVPFGNYIETFYEVKK